MWALKSSTLLKKKVALSTHDSFVKCVSARDFKQDTTFNLKHKTTILKIFYCKDEVPKRNVYTTEVRKRWTKNNNSLPLAIAFGVGTATLVIGGLYLFRNNDNYNGN